MNSEDILVILKKNCYEDTKKFVEKHEYLFADYNFLEEKYNKTGILFLGDVFDTDLMFEGSNCRICWEILSKLKYAAAGLYDDSLLLKTTQEIFGEDLVKELEIPSIRFTTKYYLKEWMEKYNFTIKDFLTNRKYVVISDRITEWGGQFGKLVDLGLINWDEIEHCSREDLRP